MPLTRNTSKAKNGSMKKILTLQGVSDHTGIPRRTLYNMIKNGSFSVPPIPKSNPRRWNVEDVDAWRFSREQGQ